MPEELKEICSKYKHIQFKKKDFEKYKKKQLKRLMTNVQPTTEKPEANEEEEPDK